MTRNEKLDQLNQKGDRVWITDGTYAVNGRLDYAGGWVLSEYIGDRFIDMREFKAKWVTRIVGRTIYVTQMPTVVED